MKSVKIKHFAHKMLIYACTLLFVNAISTFAQLQCPPNQSGMVTFDNYRIEPVPFDLPYGEITFKRGIVNGKYTIILDESSYYPTGLGVNYTFEEMKGFILTYLINEWISTLKSEGLHQCPWISPSYYEISFVFKKECKSVQCCYYKLDQTRNTLCTDIGYPFPSDNYVEWQGVRYFTYGEEVACGEKCCEWKIRVECNPDNSEDPYVRDWAKIVSVEKMTYLTNDCPITDEVDCKRGTYVPCEGDCD